MKTTRKPRALTRKQAANRAKRDTARARATADRLLDPTAAPAVDAGAVVPVPPPDIATLLARSRAAHLVYRVAVLAPDPVAAQVALREAYATRLEAHRADPDVLDPAWVSEGSHTAQLLAFYRTELAKP